jgi:mannose-6-phosphate isomerase
MIPIALGRMPAKIVSKPWGEEHWLAVNDDYVVKVLKILKGHEFSLQYHREKLETWIFVEGQARVFYGDSVFENVTPGHYLTVEPNVGHRISAIDDTIVLEASTPNLDDVVRVQDRYNRITPIVPARMKNL